MSDLRTSLESNDLKSFERIIANKQNRIQDEPFLMSYFEPLRRRMQEQVLVNLVKPFQSVSITFLASELLLQEVAVLNLLVDMISDSRLNGQIDQMAGIVHMKCPNQVSSILNKQFESLGRYAEGVTGVMHGVSNRVAIQ
jgi:hypothetical protein